MGLAKLVLRHLTVLALKNKTLAGAEVSASNLAPINDLKPATDRPVIAVFTDQTKTNVGDTDGLDILRADTTVTLALEIAVFVKPPKSDNEGNLIGVPQTDEGFEMTIDLIEAASIRELQAGTGLYSDLWKQMVTKVVSMSSERGASMEKQKFAARRVEINVQLISDPAPGKPLTETWQRVITALEAEPLTASLASVIRNAAESDLLPAWQVIRGELGITDAAARMTAIGPFPDSDAVDGEKRSATEVAGEDKNRDAVMRVNLGFTTIQLGINPPTIITEEE